VYWRTDGSTKCRLVVVRHFLGRVLGKAFCKFWTFVLLLPVGSGRFAPSFGKAFIQMGTLPLSFYRLKTPIGGCLDKKLFGLFFSFANIPLKCHENAEEKRCFLLQYVIFRQKMKIGGSTCGEKDTVDRE
jgi:hypothetical protein